VKKGREKVDPEQEINEIKSKIGRTKSNPPPQIKNNKQSLIKNLVSRGGDNFWESMR
jgi:hypothetical protein